MLREICREEALRLAEQGVKVYVSLNPIALQEHDGLIYATRRLVDFGEIDIYTYCQGKISCFIAEKRREDVSLSKKEFPEMTEEKVRQLYAERQFSMKKIAAYYGKTEGQLYNFCRKKGIDRKNPADYPDTRGKKESEIK